MITEPIEMRQPSADRLVGPKELAESVLGARTEADWAPEHRGAISAAGLRRVVEIAYYGSQLPNEGHFPRLTIFVPADESRPRLISRFSGELTVNTLRRIGPVLDSPQLGLVIEERDGRLCMAGIVSLSDALSELALSEQVLPAPVLHHGLVVEIKGPGELRAGEYLRHRLAAGRIHQERTYILDDWFQSWAKPFTIDSQGKCPTPQHAGPVGGLWVNLVRKTAALQHGGCFVILDDPGGSQDPIRHQFRTTDLDLGTIFKQVFDSIRSKDVDVRERMILRQRLLQALETASRLSATDGCVVFDRGLRLYSFGSMIEPRTHSSVPCYEGDSKVPLSEDRLQAFGARRRSAIRLCQESTWALAFIISQDGDLRAVARVGDSVRLYENLTTW